MSIKNGIRSIIDNNLVQMKEQFNAVLSQKAVEKLEEKKIEIGKSFFGKKK